MSEPKPWALMEVTPNMNRPYLLVTSLWDLYGTVMVDFRGPINLGCMTLEDFGAHVDMLLAKLPGEFKVVGHLPLVTHCMIRLELPGMTPRYEVLPKERPEPILNYYRVAWDGREVNATHRCLVAEENRND